MPTPIMIPRSAVLGVVVAVATLGLFTGCGGAAASRTSVALAEQGSSGQSGTATFSSQGSSTSVVIELSKRPAGPQPSHIHRGTCENPNPQPAFPLENVVEGHAETTVDASLEELQDGEDYYVNVHKSGPEIETVVACGDIAASEGGEDERDGGPYGAGY